MSTIDPTPDAQGREKGVSGQALREAKFLVGNYDLRSAEFGELVANWREAGLQEFELLSNSKAGVAAHVMLDRPVNTRRLSSIDGVKRWARVSEENDSVTYIVECLPQAFPPSIATRFEDVIGPYDLQLNQNGILMSLQGTHGSISRLIEEYEAAGFSPELQRIGSYEGYSRVLDELTERQREVLTVAFERDYYDIPRSVSGRDIAAEMGIEPSTVAEHLQRAEAKLVTQLLADQP